MAGPYRDAGGESAAETPRDEGIVADVIAQFADPHAYYRELVQNSIDAGSPSVEIELAYDESTERMRVAVRDRGEGMTRDIVENQLLVLFRSTKENDKSKIGKFGIGFKSVLAPNPEVVIVNTVRDRRRLTLHLYRDLSYELFDGGPATQNGTSVELELAMPANEAEAYVSASRQALVRWCRHASVPIDFIVKRNDEREVTRIDRPLALDNSLVEIQRTTDDGQLTVVIGVRQGSAPYLGFFNHGLMLHETDEPLVGNVAVKIQDSRLGHTLSRDDVRRDAHFDRAVAFARGLVRRELRDAAAVKLREHAAAGNHVHHRDLVRALVLAGVYPSRWYVPLVEPLGEIRVIDATELGRRAWVSDKATPVTAALAALGTPVVASLDIELTANTLERVGCIVRDVAAELTTITPIDRNDTDDALVAMLREVFDAAHREPRAIVLAELAGKRADSLAIAGKDDGAHVVDRDEAARDPFALLQRRPLVLSVEHPYVAAARKGGDVRQAAILLARAVLLQHELLDEDRSRRLLEHALAPRLSR